MDLSKLPRLSKTDVPPNAPDPTPAGPGAPPGGFEVIPTTSAPAAGFCACGAPLRPGARFCDSCGARVSDAGPAAALPYRAAPPYGEAGIGAEVWISIALGLIFIFMSPRIWQYFLAPASFTWTFSDANGNPLPYRQTMFFWGDLALAAFSVTLIAEGVALAFRRRGPIMLALVVTVATTLLNLAYLVAMTTQGYGLQIMSALAAAFGVYIAVMLWKMLQATRPASARA